MKKIKTKYSELNSYSRLWIQVGILTMICFYIVGLAAKIISLDVPNYFGAISVYRGSLEAAPASFAAGVVAAIICDIALKSKQ